MGLDRGADPCYASLRPASGSGADIKEIDVRLMNCLEQRSADSEFSESKPCRDHTCKNTTRGDKSYCIQHIAKNSYARHILLELETRQREDYRVKIKGCSVANIEGITCQEILLELNNNEQRTIERMTRELNIERAIIYNYALALRKAGRIQFYSDGGLLTLRLVEQESVAEVGCA